MRSGDMLSAFCTWGETILAKAQSSWRESRSRDGAGEVGFKLYQWAAGTHW